MATAHTLTFSNFEQEHTMLGFRMPRNIEPNKKYGNSEELETVQTPSDSVDDPVPAKELEGHDEDALQEHHKMTGKLFMSLTALSFLWVGSQIPLFIFGSVLPLIYQEMGGVDKMAWFVIAYLIPNACLCPFVGALSDLFGRQMVAIVGQFFLILGPTITATAHTMNIAIAGQVFSGIGAGLNELIAIAGTAELVPVRKRGLYVGMVVSTILPFFPCTIYAQLIAQASNWRYVGIPVGIWNFIGLILCIFCYKDPPRVTEYSRKAVIRQVDYIGGFLSIAGVLTFMMGLQWGASQYKWNSKHVLIPFIMGIVLIIIFFIYEAKLAKYPMVPGKLFSKDKRTMILILIITFLSGGNFFALILFWPTQVYNVYGDDPIGVGLRTLPIGFGIIFGAFLCLVFISITKGQIMYLFFFFTALMTAFTGAISISTPSNLPLMYAIVTLASIGVGATILPLAILAQLVCPDELIATITAITLAIRYLGGAVAYACYSNIFSHYFKEYSTTIIAQETLIYKGVVPYPVFDTSLTPQQRTDYETTIINIIKLVATAQFTLLKEYIRTAPLVEKKAEAYDIIIAGTQEAFAMAYRWPYWMSIAFGGICVVLARELGDVRRYLMTDRVAVARVAVAQVASQVVHAR